MDTFAFTRSQIIKINFNHTIVCFFLIFFATVMDLTNNESKLVEVCFPFGFRPTIAELRRQHMLKDEPYIRRRPQHIQNQSGEWTDPIPPQLY